MMVSTKEVIESKLNQKLHPKKLVVTDKSDGCGSKFHVLVVSEEFDGMKLSINRHRLVHSVLNEEMKSIHAIELKTLTPVEWESNSQ